MMLLDNGEVDSEHTSSTHESSSESDDLPFVGAEEGDLLMVRRLLGNVCKDLDDSQRENIFHTRCIVEGKVCSLIIDGGSCTNVVSTRLVDKLGLRTSPHPRSYKLQWLSEDGEIIVDRQILVSFSIGRYKDDVLCDVVPMEASHILLGRPWQYDRKVLHDGLSNTYSFLFKGRDIVLTPLSPKEVCEDQIKMKVKRENERKEVNNHEKKKSEKRVQNKSAHVNEKKESLFLEKKVCILRKRKESLFLERRVLMIRKQLELIVPNTLSLSSHDVGTNDKRHQVLHKFDNPLFELKRMTLHENMHDILPWQSHEIKTFNSVFAYSNPLYDHFDDAYRLLDQHKARKTETSNSISLIPSDELKIKKQWDRLFGKEEETHETFDINIEQNFNTSLYAPNCVLDVKRHHMLLLYDLKLQKVCHVFQLGSGHTWRFYRELFLLPWPFHIVLHTYSYFESYTPSILRDWHTLRDVGLIILVYDPNASINVSDLSPCLVGMDELNLGTNCFQEGGHVVDQAKGIDLEENEGHQGVLTRSMHRKLQEQIKKNLQSIKEDSTKEPKVFNVHVLNDV